MDSLKFEEKQQFRQKGMYFIYILLLVLLGLFIYADIQQIILGIPFGAKPAPDLVLIIATLFILTLILLLFMTKLETIITVEGVFFRWTPFKKAYKQFSWSYIEKTEIINYGFVGFGLRLTSYGTVYNINGDIGLQIILKSGKKVVLGTQKPKELEIFLRKINKLTL